MHDVLTKNLYASKLENRDADIFIFILFCPSTVASEPRHHYMVITYSKSIGQPGKVANPARGQLNRED